MSNPEEPVAEEPEDSHSSFNDHLKENKPAGEQVKAQMSSSGFQGGSG